MLLSKKWYRNSFQCSKIRQDKLRFPKNYLDMFYREGNQHTLFERQIQFPLHINQMGRLLDLLQHTICLLDMRNFQLKIRIPNHRCNH